MSSSETPPSVAKGVSLYADAWRRLRKNRMAMIGVVVVVVMSLLCALAGVLSPFEPTYGFTWIGPQPPGYSHPYALNKNVLTVGRAPEVPSDFADASTFGFGVNESDESEFRVKARRKKIQSIRRTAGARDVEFLALEGDQYFAEVLEDGSLGEPIKGIELRKKEKLPEVFGKQRVVMLRRITPTRTVNYEATVEAGAVVTILRDGEPLPAVERNGELVIQVAFDGRDVTSVSADGKPKWAYHPLGTDLSGRDLFSRVLHGGRISLMVGLVATLVSLIIGVAYGAISGYAGGWTDMIMMGIVDILYGIPYMFLVILLMVSWGKDIFMLFIALGLVQWLTMARIVRGQILSLKEKEFVEAARMSGSGPAKILFSHLVPNTLGVVIVYTTLTVPAVILQESFLAFIGLSVTHNGQNLESWGALVKAGVDALTNDGARSWLLIWPSLAMAATLFSLNFLGDGLRDALDPQQRGRT